MKIKSLLAVVLIALCCAGIQTASARVTFSYFYDSLSPYGDWVDVDSYGYCWQPRIDDPRWRPYTDGYWAYTDAGWTWVSYEDFGSIVYHYGRWIRLDGIGWVWKPGYEWGPAWVSWRMSDDYVGWAPLPPDADFDPDTGIGVWVDRDYDIGPSAYVFCDYRYFGAPVIRNYILPPRESVVIINSTVNITNITYIRGHDRGRWIFNGGPDYRRLSERAEHRIELLRLMRQNDGDWLRHPRPEMSRRVGGDLFIAAPEVEPPRGRFAPPKVAREIRAPKIDRGWAGVANDRERDRIKQRYQEQTRGIDRRTAPVYPIENQAIQASFNEARAARAQMQAQIKQQKTIAETEVKAAKIQAEQQIQQQKAVIEQQRRAAEFTEKAEHARQQMQINQQKTAAEAQMKAARIQAGQQQDLAEAQAKAAKVQAEQRQAAAEAQARAAKAQAEQQIQQQKAAAEQQRRMAEAQAQAQAKAAKAQAEQQIQQQRAAAEMQAKAARAQQETEARQRQFAEQQRAAAEMQGRAARTQQEAAARQQQFSGQQQRRAAESTERRSERPQFNPQPAPRQGQATPVPDDQDPRKWKHRDRDGD